MKKFIKKFWWVIPVILILAIAGFVIWAETPPQPLATATSALQSSASIQVETQPWLVFSPKDATPTKGFIFYPGGRVDARSYAPLAAGLAEKGYLAVIVPMPLNLAVFAAGKAADVITAYPEIESWVVGGHSLGGAMAANFVAKNPTAVEGLVLLGAYPASSDNISDLPIKVLSIFGTNDGLATSDKINASRALLPESTQWLPIQGGNHAQYGDYGEQAGDNPAAISRENQQAQTIQAIAQFIQNLQK